MTEIVPLNLSMGVVYTLKDKDGTVQVIFRPVPEALGIDADTQVRKLKTRSWACMGLRLLQLPGDNQVRNHRMVDRKTFTMWLATVNENNVPEEKRPQLIAYQREAADALDKYWHEGGVINPRAAVEQLDEIDRTIRRAKEQAEVLGHLRGVVDSAWLDAKGRHVAAVALGMEPDIDPANRPLTVGEFLESRGITGASLRSMSTKFGRKLKALYREKYGTEPGTVERYIDGALRPVACYTEAHRDLFNQAWAGILDTR
ncbi:phage antirepressor N-terminal domain-containing protein [Nonomuraea glycinis]|uniref:phage antirepressor N-terminal domain-containing protein n=1 Tax=Nonomuraea glycinis TaxID=2047744 RepID=UPI002E161306|nr:phage antirepressor N-terminal domain-containing protein [Nonomuraea glycinis]